MMRAKISSQKLRRNPESNVGGFTILEALAALAIMALLISVAIPAYQAFARRARTAEAKIFLSAAQTAEKSFYMTEGSYTACLAKIMPGSSGDRYFSVGFGQFSAAPPRGCGTDSATSCYQACYANNCGISCSPGSNSTFFMATNVGNTPSTDVTQLYDLANSTLYVDWSYIQAQDFLIIAAAQDASVARNDFLDRVLSTAYADNPTPKVYGIGPTGNVIDRATSRRTDFSGCCSHHGGILTTPNGEKVCRNGVVVCNDGQPYTTSGCNCY